ncbi:MAG TPA: hypothetical protein VGT99_11095 [Gammaproteobacteria bacterium]|nr:hypothetical protein [Gammaproteobacteria bacterium]
MKSTGHKLLAIASCMLLLAGCINAPPKWRAVNDPQYSVPKQGYAVKLPAGWIEQATRDSSAMAISFNGLDLESIVISRQDNDEIFKPLHKEAKPDELPADLAADFIALVKTQTAPGLQVVTNEPASVGGKSGFHVVAEFSTDTGLHYRSEAYGVCTQYGFYTLSYRAPVLYYFDQYHPAFKAVADSFRLIPMQ